MPRDAEYAGSVMALYDELIDGDLFTVEELVLVTGVYGLTEDVLADCLDYRYGYRSLEEMYAEEE